MAGATAAPGPELLQQVAPPLSAWGLIVASATPVLVVCLLASVGVVLAKRGVLRPEGCQLLARISFLVFTPVRGAACAV